ncbi:hypothetical protein DSO57_1039794 [Entomophthora muscae]|uniref:Uncharacterized protein n=1 Tax=Entomophthora muscae TaxID=34485 RepID=A0ACC2T573_9FUNG|nr:hypothetical protein DSO57_1039794 [Entomophthora muscae]
MVSITLMPASPFHSGSNIKPTHSDQPASSSKLILQAALSKAQQAVEFDHVNNFPRALQSYQEALTLITNVLDSSPSFRSNPRLINIQNSYLERVTLLTSLIDTASDVPFVNQDHLPRLSQARSELRRSILKSEEKVESEVSEGHDILSSALDAINKWPQDFNSHHDNSSPRASTSSLFPDSLSISKAQSISSTPDRFSLLLDYAEPTLGDSLRLNDRPGSLQLPQISLAETLKPPQLKLARRSSDSAISSPNCEHSGPFSPGKSLEAEFPDGIPGVFSRREQRSSLPIPFLEKFSPDEEGLPSLQYLGMEERRTVSLDTKLTQRELILERSKISSPNPKLSRVQSLSRRLSSLPTTPRPSSFLLAATKVVELAVKDSTSNQSRQAGRQYNLITIQRVFREEPSEDCVFETPPISNELRVFWLMRSLEKSMTTGGYVSRKLYIPKSVWFQSGVRLQAIEIKVQSCEVVADYLVRFKGLNVADTVNILKELEGLDALLNTVQNSLAKKLPFIEPLKRIPTSAFASLGSRITKSVEKIQMSYLKLKSDANSQYVECLIKLFKASQFLEKWYQHFVSLPALHAANVQIIARLNRVNGFLYTVFCSFVIRDMSVMLAKYLKRLRNNITD